jgi:hypothetical protein
MKLMSFAKLPSVTTIFGTNDQLILAVWWFVVGVNNARLRYCI